MNIKTSVRLKKNSHLIGATQSTYSVRLQTVPLPVRMNNLLFAWTRLNDIVEDADYRPKRLTAANLILQCLMDT